MGGVSQNTKLTAAKVSETGGARLFGFMYLERCRRFFR